MSTKPVHKEWRQKKKCKEKKKREGDIRNERIEKSIVFINRCQFPIMKLTLVRYKGIAKKDETKEKFPTRE